MARNEAGSTGGSSSARSFPSPTREEVLADSEETLRAVARALDAVGGEGVNRSVRGFLPPLPRERLSLAREESLAELPRPGFESGHVEELDRASGRQPGSPEGA
ncbi:MAG: hypothetical protein EA421_01410 [Gemmatimonadales bacterium]|nr:MAG: hypothetical protein EA421_01410 [Gemmatimonadales bacterium]